MLLAWQGPSFGVSAAAAQVDLRSTTGFAVLAGSGITNSTGPTTITGDVGTFPTTTENYPSIPTFTGSSTDHAGDSLTQVAKTDLVTVYDDIAGELPQTAIAGPGIIGVVTLGPGIYNSASTIQLNGPLILDGGGDPNAVFVFQAGSSLTTASASSVTLIGGAQACNVYWQVTLFSHSRTGTHFIGTIVALASITDNGGSTVIGRLLARNAHVTLSNTTLTVPLCSPTIATTLVTADGPIGSTVNQGTLVSDQATLTGATKNAGGTVTYTAYSDSACTLAVGDGGVRTVTNGIVQDSEGISFSILGTYYWQAVYNGDAGNHIATSACGTEVETVVAPPPPPARTSTPRPGFFARHRFLPRNVSRLSPHNLPRCAMPIWATYGWRFPTWAYRCRSWRTATGGGEWDVLLAGE